MKFVKKIVALLSVLALLIVTFSAMAVFAAPEQGGGDLMIGDTDYDGEITIRDATCVQKVLVGINEKADSFDYVADVTGNGEIDVRDVTTIQRYVNGSITKFPVEGGDEPVTTTQPQSIDPTLTDPDGWYYPIYKP